MASTTDKIVDTIGFYQYRSHITTPPPHTLIAPYLAKSCKGTATGNYVMSKVGGLPLFNIIASGGAPYQGLIDKAYARAYDKIVSIVGSEFSVNLGETLGEGRSSFEMMSKRVTQLARAYTELKSLRIGRMLRELGFEQNRKQAWVRVRDGNTVKYSRKRVGISESELKRQVKKPAQIWLEYHLGWAPVIQDVYNSCAQSHEVHPLNFSSRVQATRREEFKHHSGSSYDYYQGGTLTNYDHIDGYVSVRLKCDVCVSNPLKKRFRDMGVVNPALIAWNLTPLSMFVDWWFPVSTYLDSFTAFYGLEVTNLVRTDKRMCHQNIGNVYSDFAWKSADTKYDITYFERKVWAGVTSLPRPSLTSRSGNGIKSVTRAATAVSVLINVLR